MTREEIKEYLNRVDKLLDKLKGEDKETLSWLICGYNQCAKLLNEIQKENEKLKAEYGTKVQVERDFLNEENEKYKEVIDKIKEYIQKIFYFNEETGEYSLLHTFDKCNAKELLDILNEVSE